MYVCEKLSTVKNTIGSYDCQQWTEYTPPASFLDDLNNLSLADVNALWVSILGLFAVAYVFKHLPFFIRRR